MTKGEAIEAIQSGKRVAHNSFAQSEFMEKGDLGRVKFEDGSQVTLWEFFRFRCGIEWQTGWFVYEG